MLHLHGFGMSGAYLVATAERLAAEFQTYVPDLPGFGRSGKALRALDVTDLAHAAAAFFNDRGVDTATLVGNSMGCAVITEFARRYPDRIERAVLVAPAGGLHNQPCTGPCDSWSATAPGSRRAWSRLPCPTTCGSACRAPCGSSGPDPVPVLSTGCLPCASPRCGHRQPRPLMPGRERLREVAGQTVNHTLLVVIEGAA
jgi:pimeloyl-ACP methyl ester carboxylesterase